ncbi:hypothetical protein LV89_01125 [Arcicella aurantiaca]|uniref:Uncharacterized protein n=1 Tax=Arcicella aurantiaca TaxID=591202 RepID=A0A316ECY6_9BACT|nr:hypothetical protein LV89_01125 [Arcicella aurantiaca]
MMKYISMPFKINVTGVEIFNHLSQFIFEIMFLIFGNFIRKITTDYPDI